MGILEVYLESGATYIAKAFSPFIIFEKGINPRSVIAQSSDLPMKGEYAVTFTAAKSGWFQMEGDCCTIQNYTNPVPYVPAPIKLPKTYITLDLETTGLEMEKHGIIQIGAWATGEHEDDFKGYFLSDANPHYQILNGNKSYTCQVNDEALKVNGFTIERINDAPSLAKVLLTFYEWMAKWKDGTQIIVVGQNTAFDIAWLKRDFYRNGLDTQIFRRFADLYTLSFLKYGEPMGLARLAEKEGCRNRDAHDALTDAYTTSKLFLRLTKELAKF